VWHIDPSDSDGDGTSFTDSVTGNTVTINRATSGFATEIVKAPIWLHGGSHHLQIPSDPVLFPDISAGEELSAAASLRVHAVASGSGRLIGAMNTGTSTGWEVRRQSNASRYQIDANDGTDAIALGDNADNFTESTEFTFVGALGDGDHEAYTDGASRETSASVAVDDLDGSIASVYVGARNGASAPVKCVAVYSFAILSKRVSDTEALALHNELFSVYAAWFGFNDGFDDGFG